MANPNQSGTMILNILTAVLFLAIDALMLTFVIKPLFTRHIGGDARQLDAYNDTYPADAGVCGRSLCSSNSDGRTLVFPAFYYDDGLAALRLVWPKAS